MQRYARARLKAFSVELLVRHPALLHEPRSIQAEKRDEHADLTREVLQELRESSARGDKEAQAGAERAEGGCEKGWHIGVEREPLAAFYVPLLHTCLRHPKGLNWRGASLLQDGFRVRRRQEEQRGGVCLS